MSEAKFYYGVEHPKANKPNHIGVCAIMINSKGEILMERRADCGEWGLIGGGLKIDETLDECLKREVFEETGLRIINAQRYRIYDDPSRIVEYPDGNILRIITLCYIVYLKGNSNLRLSEESTELKLFTSDELRQANIVATHKHIIDDFISDTAEKSIPL